MFTAWSVRVSTPDPVLGHLLNFVYAAALPTSEAAERMVLETRHNIPGETAEAIEALDANLIARLGLRDGEIRLL